VVPRLGSFSESFKALDNTRLEFLALAFIFLMLTYLFAAGMYLLLAFKPLRAGRTLLVQTASGFANRVLPAGLGVITLYVQYLRKQGHSLPQALAVSGTNNLLGIVLHMMLLWLALALSPQALLVQADFSRPQRLWIFVAAVAAAIVIFLAVFGRIRHYLGRLGRQALGYVFLYRKRKGRFIAAMVCSCLLTLSHVMIFYMCALALRIDVSAAQAFVVFTVGILAATVTPTPGGVVGAEAGLTAGLVAYGVEPSVALAAALLYRFLTYWLPLIPGFVVLVTNRKLYL
jgi:uncharacterized membrane protein YbhN (UPF0104 family)